MSEVERLERACLRAWPAAWREDQFGWVHQATAGKSMRVNAVWPLGWTGETFLDDAIAQANIWCRRKGVAPCFKIADGAVQPVNLPQRLREFGFSPRMETLVMVLPLPGQARAAGAEPGHMDSPGALHDDEPRIATALRPGSIEMLSEPSEQIWSPLRDSAPSPEDFAERQGIVARITEPHTFALAEHEGAPAAIGLGVLTDDLLGLYLMRTAPNARRRGLARDLVHALLRWGEARGARTAYLQVEASNTAAVALYQATGFTRAYRYHYWLLD
jgi:N-acetylglutamate synthase